MKKLRIVLRNNLGCELDSIPANTNAEVQLAIVKLALGSIFSAGDSIAIEEVG